MYQSPTTILISGTIVWLVIPGRCLMVASMLGRALCAKILSKAVDFTNGRLQSLSSALMRPISVRAFLSLSSSGEGYSVKLSARLSLLMLG